MCHRATWREARWAGAGRGGTRGSAPKSLGMGRGGETERPGQLSGDLPRIGVVTTALGLASPHHPQLPEPT
jgi:hypothetical protein